MTKLRTGMGFDCHPLIENKKLILGGVEIPFEKGLEGHSDGDVLTHAIIDGILGAASLGDKGTLFPSTNNKFKSIISLKLLALAAKKLVTAKCKIVNIDAIIIAQSPSLSNFYQNIKENISKILNLDINDVSIKATTTDHMGFTGKNEGICSLASVLIKRS